MTEIQFAGSTFDHERDHARLLTLLQRVHKLMQDGQWHTLESIKLSCGGTEASVSARLRDLRKQAFGNHVIQHRRIDGGLWEYRAVMPENCSCPIMKPDGKHMVVETTHHRIGTKRVMPSTGERTHPVELFPIPVRMP